LFSTLSPESRVPKDHPLRSIRAMTDAELRELDPGFNALYADSDRDSIPPEKLLGAQLLMALYTIRSERQLVEQIDYNLLFRWLVGISMDDEVWDHSSFTKNRDRLLGGDIARRFFARVLGQADGAGLLSKEHFSVDGTLIEALASLKSYRPKDEDGPPGGGGRNPDVDFHGEKRRRDTHESKTDKELAVQEDQRCEVEAGLPGAPVDGESPRPGGRCAGHPGYWHGRTRGRCRDGRGAQRQASRDTGRGQKLRHPWPCRCLRCANVTAHVAQNTSHRSSAIDNRTTRHPGYAASQRFRKRIEECFGWAKTVGGLRKSRFVGREKLDFQFLLAMAAYNLVRMRNLGAVSC
jgi:transposase